MRVVTICIGGMVRSSGIADVMRNDLGIDAIALSSVNNSAETMNMLCEWADLIVPVEPQFEHKVPNEYKAKWEGCKMWDEKFNHKRKVLNLGADVWGNARNPELRKLIMTNINTIL